MEFISICDKQTLLGSFIRAFSKVFACFSSFASLLNKKLEFIEISLTFAWDFKSSTELYYADFVLIFGTKSCLVVFELNQTTFKYFKELFSKILLPLQFKCSFFARKESSVTIIYVVIIFLKEIVL